MTSSQDKYFAICVNNQSNLTSSYVSRGKYTQRSEESSQGDDGFIINTAFSILPAGTRTLFKAKYLPGPTNKSSGSGSARLSARITDFLKRSDHTFDDRLHPLLLNRGKSKFQGYSDRENSIGSVSNSLSLLSLSGSTDSLTSVEKTTGAISLVDEDSCNISISSTNAERFEIQTQESMSELPCSKSLEPELLPTNSNKFDDRRQSLSSLSRRKSSTPSPLPDILKNRLNESSLSHDVNFELNLDHEFQGPTEDFVKYKERWGRIQKELDTMKKKLVANDRSFADKITLMRKTLHQKCSEACEEVEEQRQMVVKLRKDLHSLSLECADAKSLLKEETTKTEKLEMKYQRAMEGEAKVINLVAREKSKIEQLSREKSELLTQAEYLRTELHRVKLDVHLKETRVTTLEEEMAEIIRLRDEESCKNYVIFKSKLQKQEEEYEVLAEELVVAKNSKQRLEEQIEKINRQNKLVTEGHEAELEELVESTQKKIKGLEFELITAETERLALFRSKKDLENELLELRVLDQSQCSRNPTTEERSRLKKELKCVKVLLKDAQLMAEESKNNDLSNKAVIRKLKNAFEESDSEKQQLSRLRSKAEEEVQDMLRQLEESRRSQTEMETTNKKIVRENSKLEMTLDETSRELSDVVKKYQNSLVELGIEKSNLADKVKSNQMLKSRNIQLDEEIKGLVGKVQTLEDEKMNFQNECQKVFHLKVGEAKSHLKVEEINRRRAEDHVERLKSHLSGAYDDIKGLQINKKTAMALLKQSEKLGLVATEERNTLRVRLDEMRAKNAKLEKLLEISNSESKALQVELKSSIQRAAAVKEAMKSVTNEDSDDDDTLPMLDGEFQLL